nr:GIY-YIG nuclease family protein [uncultured Rahnella sp.]
MTDQFIYMIRVQNIHTGNCYVKLGYTSNIFRRIAELEQRNTHYHYSDLKLYKHSTKLLGYIHDEQRIHCTNKKYRADVKRDCMPEGYTECYDSCYKNDLVKQLTHYGYVCVYDEQEELTKEQPMFEWA